jgi:hypothetical protein
VSIAPLNVSILPSQSVTFNSTVNGGTAPYSYQWYLDGNSVSGATAGTWLYLPSTNGIHYVYLRVSDVSNDTAQSETARVSVVTVPVGGYTVSLNKHSTEGPLTPYLALSAMLAVFLVLWRRRRARAIVKTSEDKSPRTSNYGREDTSAVYLAISEHEVLSGTVHFQQLFHNGIGETSAIQQNRKSGQPFRIHQPIVCFLQMGQIRA